MKWLPLLLGALACAEADGATRNNPHGQATGCAECHADPATGTPRLATATATCRACHAEEPHQVGIAPVSARVPEGWPLEGGKLGCLTCHHDPAHEGRGLASDNPRFFRGGPYASLGGLCQNCHDESAAARFDPHAKMRTATGAERDETCLFCHQSLPAAGATEARVPGEETCRGCHFDSAHAGSAEHLVALSPAVAERARAAHLPLAAGDRATCLTCHDPHPPGSARDDGARAEWASRPIAPEAWLEAVLLPSVYDRAGKGIAPLATGSDTLRLDASTGELCRACHGDGGPEETR